MFISDEEVFETCLRRQEAKDEDLSQDEAEELQDFIDETGLDIDACLRRQEAYDIWSEL